jgi:predicted transcriptional regulator
MIALMPFNHEYMRTRREQLKLTQQECADAAKMPQPHWARLENGKRPDPTLSTVERVARVLKCKINKLIRE